MVFVLLDRLYIGADRTTFRVSLHPTGRKENSRPPNLLLWGFSFSFGPTQEVNALVDFSEAVRTGLRVAIASVLRMRIPL